MHRKAGRPQDRQSHDRQAEIWACLQGVMDPELDESVTDLNFVTKADVLPIAFDEVGSCCWSAVIAR